MKTYYLVLKKPMVGTKTELSVVDNAKGYELIKEIQAKNYIEAKKQVFFFKNDEYVTL